MAQRRGLEVGKFDRLSMLDGMRSLAIYRVHAALTPIYRGGLAIDGSWDLIIDAAARVAVAAVFSSFPGDGFRIQLDGHNIVGVVGDRFMAVVVLTSKHKISKSIRTRLRAAIEELTEVVSSSQLQLGAIT